MTTSKITTLFLDVGGVLGTNAWDRATRRRAAATFGLDQAEMDERHHLTFSTYEIGKLNLDDYLDRVVFYQPRSFSREAFRQFMLEQSQPFNDMIALIRGLKAQHGLHVAVVSNEGRELSEYRVKAFGLQEFVDFFIFSAFVHFRKPDTDLFRLALDIAQVPAEQVLYIDDRSMFVQVAGGMGIQAVHHKDYESTRAKLDEYGLFLRA